MASALPCVPVLTGQALEVSGAAFPNVAVLYAREDSIYKSLSPHVYDIHRDARNYRGEFPVVAHPPCRAWGRLRQFSKPRPDEKMLACFAIDTVRRVGGVLEHPASSSLWSTCGLPRPGAGVDDFGGWSLELPQKWFGHRAEKNTWLYIVGVAPRCNTDIPFSLGEASHVVSSSRGRVRPGAAPLISKVEREATPIAFALWLLELAGRCAAGFGSGFLVTPGLTLMGEKNYCPVTPGLCAMGGTN